MLFSAPDGGGANEGDHVGVEWTSASVRWVPMKPSAPVTRHVGPA